MLIEFKEIAKLDFAEKHSRILRQFIKCIAEINPATSKQLLKKFKSQMTKVDVNYSTLQIASEMIDQNKEEEGDLIYSLWLDEVSKMSITSLSMLNKHIQVTSKILNRALKAKNCDPKKAMLLTEALLQSLQKSPKHLQQVSTMPKTLKAIRMALIDAIKALVASGQANELDLVEKLRQEIASHNLINQSSSSTILLRIVQQYQAKNRLPPIEIFNAFRKAFLTDRKDDIIDNPVNHEIFNATVLLIEQGVREDQEFIISALGLFEIIQLYVLKGFWNDDYENLVISAITSVPKKFEEIKEHADRITNLLEFFIKSKSLVKLPPARQLEFLISLIKLKKVNLFNLAWNEIKPCNWSSEKSIEDLMLALSLSDSGDIFSVSFQLFLTRPTRINFNNFIAGFFRLSSASCFPFINHLIASKFHNDFFKEKDDLLIFFIKVLNYVETIATSGNNDIRLHTYANFVTAISTEILNKFAEDKYYAEKVEAYKKIVSIYIASKELKYLDEACKMIIRCQMQIPPSTVISIFSHCVNILTLHRTKELESTLVSFFIYVLHHDILNINQSEANDFLKLLSTLYEHDILWGENPTFPSKIFSTLLYKNKLKIIFKKQKMALDQVFIQAGKALLKADRCVELENLGDYAKEYLTGDVLASFEAIRDEHDENCEIHKAFHKYSSWSRPMLMITILLCFVLFHDLINKK